MKVIIESDVKREAYRMGHKRFDSSDQMEKADAYECLEYFREGAMWTNNILPRLRALAGYEDSGRGTYTESGFVVSVRVEDEDDLPMDGDEVHSQYVLNELIEEWEQGAVDALSDN